jgi:predicted Rossmann fold flavoprotein
MNFDVIVIGGGAAGLMCAIEAGKRGRKVAVLEHNETVGKKIRISGGGRCNFTNTHTEAENFISHNPSFHKSALSRYVPADFIRLVRKYGIEFHEKKLGQLFCNSTSDAIIQMLLKESYDATVEVRTDCRVSEISKRSGFALTTNHGPMSCKSLAIATGGLSIPKIGASDFGYRIARQFGLRITETRPALVPLAFDGLEGQIFKQLTGVSVDAMVSFDRTSFRENVLFTHRGLSGPAILQISSYWKPGESIIVDLLPDEANDVIINPSIVRRELPQRLAQKWLEMYAPPISAFQWNRKQIDEFSHRLREWKLTPSGTEGYAKAEVTLGGVDTDELSSKTMESRRVPGLYFIGEVVDVTGQLGGFNFQWAWASGFVAGQYV